MRLFIAVDVSDEIRAHAAGLRRAIVGRDPRLERGLRWVAVEHLHLTLRFLGELAGEAAGHLEAELAVPLASAPFTWRLGGVAWLPGPARPRVLVCRIGDGADALVALQAEVEARVQRAAVAAADTRPFLAHLTLARVRDGRESDVARARDALSGLTAGDDVPAARVDAVTLYESRLSPRGPTYTPLARAPLGGGAGPR